MEVVALDFRRRLAHVSPLVVDERLGLFLSQSGGRSRVTASESVEVVALLLDAKAGNYPPRPPITARGRSSSCTQQTTGFHIRPNPSANLKEKYSRVLVLATVG